MAEGRSTGQSGSSAGARPVTVLIVDDEPRLVEVMSVALGRPEYDVLVRGHRYQALEAASVGRPDVVLLDIGLPDIDGVSVCRQLRELVLQPDHHPERGRGRGPQDRSARCRCGRLRDEAVLQPELVARIRVASRHREPLERGGRSHRFVGDLVIDVGADAAWGRR